MKLLIALILTLLSVNAFAEEVEGTEDPTPPPMSREELQPIFDRVAEGCKDHFDVRPYYDVAMGKEESKIVTSAVLDSLQSFGETGRIQLPADKVNDLEALKCVTFAEGLVTGGLGHSLVHAFIQAAAEVAAKMVDAFVGPLVKVLGGMFGVPPTPPAKAGS